MSNTRADLEREDLGLFGQSHAIQKLRAEIRRAASSSAPVLITGETGTGKELVAKAVHNLSQRRARPLIAVNCGALNAQLLESELFGHSKGAFTGAIEDKQGKFQVASGSSLFLDEINSTTLDFQTKLLRVIQDGEVTPVGSSVVATVDVRIIAASNKNLASEVAAKRFREDLFYRLWVIPLHVPPLRERAEDIIELSEHFVIRHSRLAGTEFAGLSDQSKAVLLRHNWPGNVRELENVIQRSVLMATETGRETPLEVSTDWVGPLSVNSGPARGGEIADFVMDALLAHRAPLLGLLKGDTETGELVEYIMNEIAVGVERYLQSVPGQELVSRKVRKGHILERMGLSTRPSGNSSQLNQSLRQCIEQACEANGIS